MEQDLCRDMGLVRGGAEGAPTKVRVVQRVGGVGQHRPRAWRHRQLKELEARLEHSWPQARPRSGHVGRLRRTRTRKTENGGEDRGAEPQVPSPARYRRSNSFNETPASCNSGSLSKRPCILFM